MCISTFCLKKQILPGHRASLSSNRLLRSWAYSNSKQVTNGCCGRTRMRPTSTVSQERKKVSFLEAAFLRHSSSGLLLLPPGARFESKACRWKTSRLKKRNLKTTVKLVRLAFFSISLQSLQPVHAAWVASTTRSNVSDTLPVEVTLPALASRENLWEIKRL